MSTPTRLLVLGTGTMAKSHAERFAQIPGCVLVGAVDVNPERARAYAATYNIPGVFDDLDAAIRWGGFDAAINATPDAAHKPTTLQLIAAGKSVLCEKPLAVNAADAFAMTEAAEAAGVIAMVNLSCRNAPAIQQARQMVDAGEIGTVRHTEASYLQSWLTANYWGDWRAEERLLWRLSTAHGSNGVLGDLGIHLLDAVSFCTCLDVAALYARLKAFAKAEGGRIGPYQLDANDSVVITAEMTNGALAAIHMSRFATGNRDDLHLAIHGDRGALKVSTRERESRLEACRGEDTTTQRWVTVRCPETPRNEQRFVAALQSGRNGEPSFRRAAEVQRLLDLCVQTDGRGCMMQVA